MEAGERLRHSPHLRLEGPQPQVCPADLQGLQRHQRQTLPRGPVPLL